MKPRLPVLGLLLVLVALSSIAAAQTWTLVRWTDPSDAGVYDAITTPIEFGPEGVAALVCTSDGATLLLQSGAFAAAPDAPIVMNYRMDMDDEVNDFSNWVRGPSGTTVRFAGTSEEFAVLMQELRDAFSPAFFWVHGEPPADEAEAGVARAEGRMFVAVLESQRLDDALTTLPCSVE